MSKDAREELERLEKALLEEDGTQMPAFGSDDLDDDELAEIEAILSHPERPAAPQRPRVRVNNPNDYDGEQEHFSRTGKTRKKKKGDTLSIILMSIACLACIGLICVLAYWMKNFL